MFGKIRFISGKIVIFAPMFGDLLAFLYFCSKITNSKHYDTNR